MSQDIQIQIRVDDKGTVHVRKLGEEAERAGRKAGSAFRLGGLDLGFFNKEIINTRGAIGKVVSALTSVKALLASGLAAAGIGALGKEFTSAASTTEDLRERLARLLGSVDEGSKLFREMSDYASRVPYEYEQIMASATTLAGVMKGGADEVSAWIPLIGDLAAASGLSIQDTTDQVVRMYSSGAASADLFRERGVLAMLGFQAGVSYSAEETRQVLVNSWLDAASKFRGATGDIADNWSGMKSMMSDVWFGFRNMVMESGLFEFMKNGFSDILAKLGEWKKDGTLQDWAQKLSDYAIGGVLNFITVLEVLHNTWNGIKLVGVSALWAISAGLDEVFKGLRVLIAPLDLIYKGMEKLIPGFVNPLDQVQEKLASVRGGLADWRDEIVGDMNEVHGAYQDVLANVEAWRKGLEDTGKTASDMSNVNLAVLTAAAKGEEDLTKATEDSAQDRLQAERDALAEREKLYADYKAAILAHIGDLADAEAAAADGAGAATFGNQVGLSGGVIQVVNTVHAMRSFGKVEGTAYYSQENLDRALENANADYQYRMAQYEAAVREAEEVRRQWQGVLSSYESLLSSIEEYQPTLSLPELEAKLDKATSSVKAAKDFLQDLSYYAKQLQGYKSGFEGLSERIQSEITAREREGWGASEYTARYQTLSAQYAALDAGADDYYDAALEISEDMLDALLSIESAQDEQVAATASLRASLVGVLGSLDSSISSLYASDLAPAQSLEFYLARYQTLYNRASSSLSSEDVSALTQFVQQSYLPFLQSFGGDYQSVFDSTVEDLEALQDAVGYSILGTFTSLNDALQTTGAFAEWLAARLGEDLTGALGTTGTAASSSTLALANISTELGTLAENTSTSLAGVVTSLNALVTTLEAAIASIESQAGTTINISAPSTPSTTLYDFNWSWVLTKMLNNYVEGYFTTPHGGHVSWSGYTTSTAWPPSAPTYGYAYTAAEGMIFQDEAMTRIGERHKEAAVPFTEEHLSRFFGAAGWTPENIAGAVERAVTRSLGGTRPAGGNMEVRVYLDSRELRSCVVKLVRYDPEAVTAIQGHARRATS